MLDANPREADERPIQSSDAEAFRAVGAMLDDRILGFSDALLISGIDPRQLRNGLDRGLFPVGEKLRAGRWAFSVRDCFHLLIVRQLTTRAWVPVSAAAMIASQIAARAEQAFEATADLVADASNGEIRSQMTYLIFAEGHEATVVVNRRAPENSYSTLDGDPIETDCWQEAHIEIRAESLVLALGHGLTRARVDPERERAAIAAELRLASCLRKND